MSQEFHLTPLSADVQDHQILEAMGVLPEPSPESQFCVFRSGRERFCLPVLDVEEVLEWPLVTELPLSPAYLMGIFNLRGAIVPLIDIAMTEGRRPGLLPKNVVVAALHIESTHEDVRIGIAVDLQRPACITEAKSMLRANKSWVAPIRIECPLTCATCLAGRPTQRAIRL